MRVLLHACCGPCLIEPIDALLAEGHDIEIAYANPNIHPRAEYEVRRDTLLAYAGERGWKVRELAYDPVAWMRAVAGVEDDPPRRCAACWALRIGMVAGEAAREGFDAIATTLSVSPYQDAEGVRIAAETAARDAGVAYVGRDFRERYPEATRRSRELGMYRQNYCGCLLSDIEARAEREQRRAERRAAREADAR